MPGWWTGPGSDWQNQANAIKCKRNMTMAWTTPTLVEICIGLEINGYLPAEI